MERRIGRKKDRERERERKKERRKEGKKERREGEEKLFLILKCTILKKKGNHKILYLMPEMILRTVMPIWMYCRIRHHPRNPHFLQFPNPQSLDMQESSLFPLLDPWLAKLQGQRVLHVIPEKLLAWDQSLKAYTTVFFQSLSTSRIFHEAHLSQCSSTVLSALNFLLMHFGWLLLWHIQTCEYPQFRQSILTSSATNQDEGFAAILHLLIGDRWYMSSKFGAVVEFEKESVNFESWQVCMFHATKDNCALQSYYHLHGSYSRSMTNEGDWMSQNSRF